MNTIHPLSQNIISKIAAGEVIERPVYAVKELIENSLDAQATAITIQIEESGLKRITVIDDGHGMSPEDIRESFKHHRTSKITSEEDLVSIETHGFRGEALSSIAAISKMTIKSKTSHDKAGRILELRNGRVEKFSPIGMPKGTVITVENLFYSVPGRKKFLKSLRTEFRYIIDTVTNFAIAYPHISFTLIHNGKMLFDLPKTTDSMDRIYALMGNDIFSNLLPIAYTDSYITISGFITKPQITTSTPYKQHIFINKRKVADRAISLAIKDAYGNALHSGAYPVCFLFLSLPYEAVDVNVHPRKEQVRFVNNQLIFDAVNRAIAKTLAENNLTFHKNYWENSPSSGESEIQDAPTFGNTKSYAGRLLKEKQLPWKLQTVIESTEISQIHNLYLFTPTKHGVLLIDQHAAHERILFEQLLEQFENEAHEKRNYTLPEPVLFDLSFTEAELLHEYIDFLARLGFEIAHFKGNSFLLHNVPMLFHDRNHKKLIQEIMEDIQQKNTPKELDTISKRMIAYLACRAAVKAGDPLDKKQRKELVDQLQKTRNNATCPHGRPIQIEMLREQIDRLFRRK